MNKYAYLSVFIFGFIIFFNKESNIKVNVDEISKLKEPKKINFNEISDVTNKKNAFFNYMYPFIVNKNIDIIKIRKNVELEKGHSKFLNNLCQIHKISCSDGNYHLLLNKVKIIPPSLIMAQAANESAWGTSRFSVEANNYFGIWCFSKGCGLIPFNRDNEKTHEVKRFINTQDSVNYYVDNINRNHHYDEFKKIRIKTMNSVLLVNGLIKYSENGADYVDEIIDIIEYNELKKYDYKMFEYLNLDVNKLI